MDGPVVTLEFGIVFSNTIKIQLQGRRISNLKYFIDVVALILNAAEIKIERFN